jgi:hypothetical protein
MDGEGLGGQVNIKTKSPFDAEGLAASFTAQGQYADQSGKFSQKCLQLIFQNICLGCDHVFFVVSRARSPLLDRKRERTAITGCGLKPRKIIEAGRLAGVVWRSWLGFLSIENFL